MQISVTANKVEITDKNIINKGEYNIHTCEFTFSEEYSFLIKRAVFTAQKSYVVEIDDNSTCIIPQEVLGLQGNVIIGVYAYENNENNELQLRYSPEPTKFFVNNGSYISSANVTIPYEAGTDLIKQVKDLIADVQERIDNGDFDGVGIQNITFNLDYTMTILLTDGRSITSQPLRGEKGEEGERGIQGETGEPGYTPQKGIDYYTDEEKEEMQDKIEQDIDETLIFLQEQINVNKMELTENELAELINDSF